MAQKKVYIQGREGAYSMRNNFGIRFVICTSISGPFPPANILDGRTKVYVVFKNQLPVDYDIEEIRAQHRAHSIIKVNARNYALLHGAVIFDKSIPPKSLDNFAQTESHRR